MFRNAENSCFDAAVLEAFQEMIERYHHYYGGDPHAIPEHRSFDLIDLKDLLTNSDLSHSELNEKIEAFVDKMMTGLIIDGKEKIGTGRSRLRSMLKTFVNHHAFNKEAMQKRDVRRQALKAKLEREVVSNRDVNIHQGLQDEIGLKNDLIQAQQANMDLLEQGSELVEKKLGNATEANQLLNRDLTKAKEENTALQTERSQLRLKIHSLQENNKNLQAKVESLQKQYADEQKKNETLLKEKQQHSPGQSQTHAHAQAAKPASAKPANKSSWSFW